LINAGGTPAKKLNHKDGHCQMLTWQRSWDSSQRTRKGRDSFSEETNLAKEVLVRHISSLGGVAEVP